MTAFLPLAQAEWGTVPDWVTAFGTLAAFAVALRLLAKELAARREVEEDRRRQQARLVVAWLTIEPPSESNPSTADSTIDHYSYPYEVQQTSEDRVDAYLLARNGSDEPIYAVRAIVVRHSSPFSSDPEAALRQSGNLHRQHLGPFPPLTDA